MAKKRVSITVLLAAGVLAASTLAGCATFSSVGGTGDSHGLISGAKAASSDAEIISSYGIILGLIDTGYESYVKAVRDAEAAGKQVSSVTTWFLGIYTKVTAYAK